MKHLLFLLFLLFSFLSCVVAQETFELEYSEDSEDPQVFTAVLPVSYRVSSSPPILSSMAFSLSMRVSGLTLPPTAAPIAKPSKKPTTEPSSAPSKVPVATPTNLPSEAPTVAPTKTPTFPPTKVPTKLPTTLPTASPTATPTARPTAVPTTLPTPLPTLLPTLGTPTALPTPVPSSNPTVVPSFAPTPRPTRVPTAIPTTVPSAVPTAVPTTDAPTYAAGVPTPQPTTAAPTASPSAAPSRVPTRSPTFSALDLFLNPAKQALASFESTYQEHYTEYWFGGSRVIPAASTGSSEWKTFVASDLTVKLATYAVSAIAISSVDSMQFAPKVTTCSDAVVATSLLKSYLTVSSITSAQTATCGSASWTVNRCGTFNAICVNCVDPCAVTCQSDLSVIRADRLPTCNGNASYFGATSFGVSLIVVTPPTPVFVESISTATSITMHFNMSSAGILRCGTFAPGAVPSALSEISGDAQQTNSKLQVKLELVNLLPSSLFDIFCYTEGFLFNKMTLADAIAYGPTSLETKCCRVGTLTRNFESLGVGKSGVNVLEFSVDFLPLNSVTFTFAASGVALYPASYTFVAGQSVTSVLLSVPVEATASSGTKTLTVTASGPSSALYSVAFTRNFNSFEVLRLDQSPPAPTIQTAVFNSLGSQLLLSLSSPASVYGALAASFNCSFLFDFGGASTSSCQFTSSLSLVVVLSSTATVEPGDMLGFQPKSSSIGLQAVCSSAVANCLRTSPHSVQVSSPAVRVRPSVSVVAPALVSSALCTKFSINIAGSTGSGGRAWAKFDVSAVASNGGNQSYVSSALSTYSLAQPTVLRSEQMTTGLYIFQATLCNFLGACGSSSTTVTVIDSSVPTTTIFGQVARTINTKEKLLINYDSYVTSCTTSERRTNLNPSWSLTRDDQSIDVVGRQSFGVLSVPAYTLTVGSVYTYTLRVAYSLSTLTPQPTSVVVTVVPGSLVAVISGSSYRGVRVDGSTFVDASKSYDEDVQNVFGARTGLTFEFACIQTSPVLSTVCSFTQQVGSSVDQLTFAGKGDASLDTASIVTLTLSDSTRSRSDSVSLTLAALPSRAPLASIKLGGDIATTGHMNADVPLQLTLGVQYNSEGTTAVFSLEKDNMDSATAAALLQSFTSQPLTRSLPGSSGSAQYVVTIPPNNLSPGMKLRFVLTASAPGTAPSRSVVSVQVNFPPQPGSFVVSPTTGGITMKTQFHFLTSNFQSDSLPLRYVFGFFVTDVFLHLNDASETAELFAPLPEGLVSNAYLVTTQCVVSDAFDATYMISSLPESRPNSDSSAAANVLADILASGDTSKAIATGAGNLNAADCSSSPSCSSLRRAACSTVSNTCGACLSGYSGDPAPSNSKCVSMRRLLAQPSVTSLAGGSCSTDDDCSNGFEVCESGTCTLQSKSCTGNCNGNGVCTLVDANLLLAKPVEECFVGDATCKAVCECADGWYGDACSLSETTVVSQALQRQLLVDVIFNATQAASDITATTLDGWVSGVQLILNADLQYLPKSTVEQMYEIVDFILFTADKMGLYYTDFEGLLLLLNKAAADDSTSFDYTGDGSTSTSRRKLIQYTADDGRSVSLSVYQYAQLVLGSLEASEIVGSSAISEIVDRFSLLYTTTNAGGVTSLVTPRSFLEQLSGVQTQEVEVTNLVTSKVALIQWKASTYPVTNYPEFIANPLSLVFDNFTGACTGQGCKFSFNFKNFEPKVYTIAHNKSFTTACTGVLQEVTYDCPQNLTVTAVCKAGFTGTVVTACPFIQPVPRCFRVDPFGQLTEEWAISVTDTNSTCVGVVVTSELDYYNTSDVGHVEVVPMMTYEVIHFKPVLIYDKSPFKFEIILFIVFLTIGVFIVAAVVWRFAFAKNVQKSGGVYDGANINLVAFDPIMDAAGEADEDDEHETVSMNDFVINRSEKKRMSTGRTLQSPGLDEIPSPGSPAEGSRLSIALTRGPDGQIRIGEAQSRVILDGATTWGHQGGDSGTDSDKDSTSQSQAVVRKKIAVEEVTLGGL